MNYLDLAIDLTRMSASHILGTDRAVVTKRIYPGPPHLTVNSLDEASWIMADVQDDAHRDWLYHNLIKFKGTDYCERCDTVWIAKDCFTQGQEDPICDACLREGT